MPCRKTAPWWLTSRQGTRSTGLILAFRPYFQQAIQGATSVYAAIGSNTQERGLYYAAPLYESDTPSSNIIDVVMFRGGFEPVDLLLKPALCAVARHRHHGQRRRGGPPALLCGRHERPCCQAHRACGPVGCAGLCVQARVFARPVLQHQLRGKGTHCDPDMVDAFVDIAQNFRSIAHKYLDPA